MAACVVRYTALFAAGWTVVTLTSPGLDDPGSDGFDDTLPYGETVRAYWELAPGMFATVGGLTLLVLVCLSRRRNTQTESAEFRLLVGTLTVVPLMLFAMFGWPSLIVVLLAVQGVFAGLLMPVGPRRVMPWSRAGAADAPAEPE
ncbi:hypothetical protein [Streptomyces sp. NPDC051183]|uniref:hypothetical protein n=1 Tax=Streptomyces sp. NPDC051183 TaxID=3155165 RepID=UPI0034366237